jgi:peptidoglycan hydrolase-like protein with peptidoglycan-binding domain
VTQSLDVLERRDKLQEEVTMSVLKQGSRGDEVKTVQEKLQKLGFAIQGDGIFGDKTHAAVITMQTIFGYDTDGMVGPATVKLLDQQLGFGWSVANAQKAHSKPSA